MAKLTYSIRYLDSLGDERTEVIFVPKGTQTLAQMTTWINNYLAAMAPILDGALLGAEVTIPLAVSSSLTSPTVTPAVGSDVNLGATFSFRNNVDVAWSFFLPTYLHANQSKDIPITGATQTFTNACITGVTNGTDVIALVDRSEIPITVIKKAYGSQRK